MVLQNIYIYNNIFFILKVSIVMCISHHTNFNVQITNYFPFFNSFKDYLWCNFLFLFPHICSPKCHSKLTKLAKLMFKKLGNKLLTQKHFGFCNFFLWLCLNYKGHLQYWVPKPTSFHPFSCKTHIVAKFSRLTS